MLRTKNRRAHRGVGSTAGVLSLLLFPFAFLIPVPNIQGGRPPQTVRIGVARSLFRDVPDAKIGMLMPPFRTLMQAQTGLPSELASPEDADDLAEELMKDHVQLGIFQGVEFAWARQKHPELQPLVIAVNQQQHRRAHLIVLQDFPATAFTGLKGKAVAMPRRSREHCHVFLERQCQALGREPSQFFARIATPANIEEALDDVVDGVVQAAVVDGVGLDCYKRRKPGRFAMLKELLKSELFPATAVAYRKGAIDEATLKRFRDGLIKADKTATGRLMLLLWTLTAFEAVPADYERMLTEIIKAYPAPRPDAATKGGKEKESERSRPKAK